VTERAGPGLAGGDADTPPASTTVTIVSTVDLEVLPAPPDGDEES
jgi:hypothetical protein